tara:strand:+ start:149 stop:679 length:531 start_codon:yes stop_codon:yes gene_type:complete
MKNITHSTFVILLLISTLIGCTSKYKIDAVEAPTESINTQSKFYILLARDGQYGSKIYQGSGQMTTNAVYSSLVTRGVEVEKATKVENKKLVLLRFRKEDFDYIFVPTILHWEDRSTEWSGKPDRITLHYAVYDVSTRKEIASTTARASSKWLTFGGDHPQDLLPAPTRKFVDTLF